MRITAGGEILDEGDPLEEGSAGGDVGDGDGAGPGGIGARERVAWYAAALAVALGLAGVAAVVEALVFGRLDLARVALV